MRLIKLIDCPDLHICLGTTLEFPGGVRFDDQIVRCVFCQAFRYEIGYEIYVISGEYAGRYVGFIPSSALVSPKGPLGKEWVIENWSEYFGHLCDIDDVNVFIDE